jgi:hypothetical protein
MSGLSRKRRSVSPAPRRFIPTLEYLENPITLDAMTWTGNAGSNWSNAGSWFDQTTKAVATRAPNSGDDVDFTSAATKTCAITSPQSCNTLDADPKFGLLLEFDGGTLTVNNSNNATSQWQSGSIIATGNPGTINIMGGTFEYTASTINSPANSPSLDIWVGGGANLRFKGNSFNTLGANLHVGYTAAHNTTAPGTVNFTSLTNIVTTANNSTITVSNQGTLNFNDGTSVTGLQLTSSGTVFTDDNVNLSTATNVPMT